jgi:hypothetical protein
MVINSRPGFQEVYDPGIQLIFRKSGFNVIDPKLSHGQGGIDDPIRNSNPKEGIQEALPDGMNGVFIVSIPPIENYLSLGQQHHGRGSALFQVASEAIQFLRGKSPLLRIGMAKLVFWDLGAGSTKYQNCQKESKFSHSK